MNAHRTFAPLSTLLTILLLAALAACSSPTPPPDDPNPPDGDLSAGWVDESGTEYYEAPAEPGEPGLLEGLLGSGGAVEESAAAEPMPSAEMAEDTMVMESESVDADRATEPEELNQNSRLTAGNVDDNAQWDDYLLYRREYSGARVLDADITTRHQILVTDGDGFPVLDAEIDVAVGGQSIAGLRTHSNGRAYFFPNSLDGADQADEYRLTITAGDAEQTLTIPADSGQREWPVTFEQTIAPDIVRLDVLFLIDATGSMGDEINQLKENVRLIANQIDSLPTETNVRFGMTAYRDRGDEYVSRTFDFTPDVAAFQAGLDDVQANGGGDYPEDLNEGLAKALTIPEWRVQDTVSLIFLIADAPPQLGYDDQQTDYVQSMKTAAARGIKIYPIASSGLDEQGEYIFRQLAQYTGGRFLFLTYGAGGAGTTGTETSMNVEEYDVTSLDGMVINIIAEELAPLNREAPQQ